VIAFPEEIPPPYAESLSISLTCTNGTLPGSLNIGDIKEPVFPLPQFISAANIIPVRSGQLLPADKELLQKLTAHLCLNHLSLQKSDHLQKLLELYLFPDQGGKKSVMAVNRRRIAGIQKTEAKKSREFAGGIPLSGLEISMEVRQDHFAGRGDMYLFGSVLEQFIGSYSSLNCYTKLEFNDASSGGYYSWPVRLNKTVLP
jgi:type VI secretion system protein ImpG